MFEKTVVRHKVNLRRKIRRMKNNKGKLYRLLKRLMPNFIKCIYLKLVNKRRKKVYMKAYREQDYKEFSTEINYMDSVWELKNDSI